MQQMTAVSVFDYAGVRRQVGETVEIDDAHVRVLTAAGRVKPKEEKREAYKTRNMTTDVQRAGSAAPAGTIETKAVDSITEKKTTE